MRFIYVKCILSKKSRQTNLFNGFICVLSTSKFYFCHTNYQGAHIEPNCMYDFPAKLNSTDPNFNNTPYLVQDQLHIGIWLLDLKEPYHGKINSYFWKALGYSDMEKSLEVAPWQSFVAPEDLPATLHSFQDFIDKPPVSNEYSKVIKFLHKNGSSVWMECKGLLRLDKSNKPQLALTLHDITSFKEQELKLEEKINFYTQLIDGTNTGTWQWNVQTEELILNESWAAILGYTLEELGPLTSNLYNKLAHPDDLEKSSKLLRDHFEGKNPFYECETRMKHKDGHWVWIRDKGKLVSRSNDGHPEWVGGSHQKISQLKNDQYLVHRYKDLLERSNEAARIGSWEIDLITEKMTWCKTTKEIHEVSDDYIPNINNSVAFFKEGESQDLILKSFKECISSGKKYDIDLEIITAKGTEKWVRAIGIPVMKNGSCIRAYGLFQDIDKITKAQKELAFKEEQLRLTFENAAIGMALVDLDGKWLKVNNSLCDMLGFTPEEFLQLKFQDITHPIDLAKDAPFIEEMLQNKRDTFKIEKRYIHKDGTYVWAHLATSIIKNDKNEPLHFVAQITDVSEKKKSDKKIKSLLDVTVEQNKRLLNFAHIVSHNLRSHSGNFLMLLDLIKEEAPEHAENEYFPHLTTTANNLMETISQLNEVVSMNTEINKNLKPVNLKGSVEKAVTSISSSLFDAKLQILIDIDETIEPMVIPAYLDSVILNLLTNAVKYRATSRDPYLQISAVSNEESITIVFKDNGVGIDMKLYGSKIFGMYKTFHSNQDSQGIGLFITKNQVEAMNGTIEVTSQVDIGTTFTIHLEN